jgi:hypothetical protein
VPTHKTKTYAKKQPLLLRIILHIRQYPQGDTAYMHASIIRNSKPTQKPFFILFFPRYPPEKAVSASKKNIYFLSL